MNYIRKNMCLSTICLKIISVFLQFNIGIPEPTEYIYYFVCLYLEEHFFFFLIFSAFVLVLEKITKRTY